MSTLRDATIDELQQELGRRCPIGILMLSVPDDNRTHEARHYAWGDRFTILGFATTASMIARSACVSKRLPPPTEPAA